MRVSEEQFEDIRRRLDAARKASAVPARVEQKPVALAAVEPAKVVKRSKYRNTRTERHGLKFDSVLEADWFDHLRMLCRTGKVLWFVRQVNFELPGGVRYRADYVVMYASHVHETDVVLARPEVHDCKGFDTRESKNKRKQVRAVHGVEVRIVKAADLTVPSS